MRATDVAHAPSMRALGLAAGEKEWEPGWEEAVKGVGNEALQAAAAMSPGASVHAVQVWEACPKLSNHLLQARSIVAHVDHGSHEEHHLCYKVVPVQDNLGKPHILSAEDVVLAAL